MTSEQHISERHVVVSGGTGGLGEAVVSQLLEEDDTHCWIPCYGTQPPEISFSSHDRAHLIQDVDLTKPAEVEGFYSKMPSLWASIHIAGGFSMAHLEDTKLADFEHMWRMNTVTCFLSCQAAVRRMREGNGGGRIVNVAARPVLEPAGGMLAYTTSKAGVASLTECLAREVSSDGILVNAILPSIIDTPVNRQSMPKADHESWPKAAEIANMVAFLSSEANSLTSGALLPVYGKLL